MMMNLIRLSLLAVALTNVIVHAEEEKAKDKSLGGCFAPFNTTDYPDLAGKFKLRYSKKADSTNGRIITNVKNGVPGCSKKKKPCVITLTDGNCSSPGDVILGPYEYKSTNDGKTKYSDKIKFGFEAEDGVGYVAHVYDKSSTPVACAVMDMVTRIKC